MNNLEIGFASSEASLLSSHARKNNKMINNIFLIILTSNDYIKYKTKFIIKSGRKVVVFRNHRDPMGPILGLQNTKNLASGHLLSINIIGVTAI